MDGRYNARRSGAPGPHAHGNAATQVLRTTGGRRRCVGSKPRQTTPATTSTPSIRQPLGAANARTAPATSSTAPVHQRRGSRARGNDTSKSTGRSGRQNAATRRNTRRAERVTVQGPVKKLQPDGMSHGGWGGGGAGLGWGCVPGGTTGGRGAPRSGVAVRQGQAPLPLADRHSSSCGSWGPLRPLLRHPAFAVATAAGHPPTAVSQRPTAVGDRRNMK